MEAPLPADEAERLEALRRYAILDTVPEGAFDDIARLAAHLCEAPISLISLVDADRQWFKARCGLSAEETPRSLSFCAHSILRPDVLVIPDTLRDARFADNAFVTGEPRVRFYAGAPLVTPDGFRLGTLCVIDRVPRHLRPDQIDALRALARLVVTQLELRHALAERALTEAALRESEERSRTLLARLPQRVFFKDRHGVFLSVNDAFARDLGLRPEALAGKTDRDLFPPELAAKYREDDLRVIEGRETLNLEEVNVIAGRERIVEVTKSPILAGDGGVIGVLGVFIDITGRRRAQEALRQAHDALEARVRERTADLAAANEALGKSEERYRSLVIASAQIVWTTNADGRVEDIPMWRALTGQTEEQVRGWGWLEALHPDDREQTAAIWSRAVAAKDVYATEYRVRRRDGVYRHFAVRGVPVLEADGSLREWVGACTDITESKEAALKQRAFLRDVLRSVTEGKLHLCDAEGDLPEPLDPAGEPVALAAPALRTLRHRVHDAARDHGLSEERRQDLVTAAGEAAMNAVVHAGGGEARIRAGGAAGTVQVWVQDQGAGIAMDYLHRATLERGYTTAGSLGHGFWLMLKTCDRIWLLTGPTGTTVVLEQDRTTPEPGWLAG